MEGIRIKNTTDGMAEVYTPYSAEFVAALKRQIGGARWNNSKKCWTVPEEALDAVREIIKSVYGYTDVEDAGRLCTVVLRTTDIVKGERGPVSLFNRPVARAYGRDSGATVCDGVVFKEGAPESWGSVKWWYTVIPEGCVFEMHHVPEKAIEKESLSPDYEILSITPEEDDSRKKLLEERERLLARLAEIDKELGNL